MAVPEQKVLSLRLTIRSLYYGLYPWALSCEAPIRTIHRHRLFWRKDARVEPQGLGSRAISHRERPRARSGAFSHRILSCDLCTGGHRGASSERIVREHGTSPLALPIPALFPHRARPHPQRVAEAETVGASARRARTKRPAAEVTAIPRLVR